MAKKSNKPTKAIIALEITSNDAFYFYSYFIGQLITAEKLKTQTAAENKYIKQNLAKLKQLLTADQIRTLKGMKLLFEKSFNDAGAETEIRTSAHNEVNSALNDVYRGDLRKNRKSGWKVLQNALVDKKEKEG